MTRKHQKKTFFCPLVALSRLTLTEIFASYILRRKTQRNKVEEENQTELKTILLDFRKSISVFRL